MRKAPVLIAVFLAVAMAGCVASGKPGKPAAVTPTTPKPTANTAVAAAPEPLSIPQTQVELPKPQPLDPAAWAPEPAPVVGVPAATSSGAAPVAGRGGQPRVAPVNPNPPAGPPATTPSEPTGTIQEIVPAAELKRYRDQARGRWGEIQGALDQLAKRRLTPAQKDKVTSIRSFLGSSMAAEKKGDMKLADALAERAQILARDLLRGK